MRFRGRWLGRRIPPWRRRAYVLATLLVVLPLLASAAQMMASGRPHWSNASHATSGQAPAAATTPEAVLQVYAARTWGLRGALASHSWITSKRRGAAHYRRYEVIGWRAFRGRPPLRVKRGIPDGEWFSNVPLKLVDLRGPGVEELIDKVETAVRDYPHAADYSTWPGPNSNTFTAYIGRQVPELGLDLPPTAIGKDYLPHGAVFGRPPSGRGFQVSLFGVAGILVGLEEGIEVNLFGLVVGLDFNPPALKLPGLGRLGWD
ncbi:MAG TPA: DUF3750 domain-containing protein [Alphaproteobacteria bacterium]|nr:DUF3750 domain-containing protein [Alphaproteobacteria bacterium]MDP6271475.1 DUF3750 domain-containing protein [Alphaproteobacteria bacterium]MDP7429839.1 DUF3750 domain-containing protein [Alphaproteobacteria bacterium]HJM51832.1 DUF3750 domain-containing protein [Alphaproteobacteria bacterium]